MSTSTTEAKPLPTVMDAGEVARAIGIARRTVLEWAQMGKLPDPVVNQPKVKRWNRQDIDHWLTTGRKPPRR